MYLVTLSLELTLRYILGVSLRILLCLFGQVVSHIWLFAPPVGQLHNLFVGWTLGKFRREYFLLSM